MDIYQLMVLSRLRNLQEETIKQTEAMALTIDVEKDILYKRGIEKGIMKSRLEMAKKMKEEGVSMQVIAKITGLSDQEISKL